MFNIPSNGINAISDSNEKDYEQHEEKEDNIVVQDFNL